MLSSLIIYFDGCFKLILNDVLKPIFCLVRGVRSISNFLFA